MIGIAAELELADFVHAGAKTAKEIAQAKGLEDNMGALAVNLTPDDLKETDERIRGVSVAGDRYTPEMMAMVNR